MNRSVLRFRVGQSSDGRGLPLYPTPFSQLQHFSTPRLTRALSRLGFMNENPFKPPTTEAIEQSDSVSGAPHRINQTGVFRLFPILVSAAAWSISYLAGSDSAMGTNPTLFTLLLATASSTWVYHDAKRRGVKIVGAVNFLIFFGWLVAVPIYLIYTRGKTGWLWVVLQAVGVCGGWYAGWTIHI